MALSFPSSLDGVPVERRALPIATTGPSGPLRLTLDVLLAGPDDGVPVLLLHGFPDTALGWRHQIPALARAGYRVIAPNQRGYADSGKPAGVFAYRAEHLAADVVGVLDALGCGAAHVVGHDWGGGVAWSVAERHPDRVESLTVVNCPRPEVLRRCLLGNFAQLRKSWYILYFQLPSLGAWALSRGAAWKATARTARPGTFTEADLDHLRAAATPEAMRAATAWYKAAFWSPADDGPIRAPTLLLWGTADVALGPELAAPSLSHAPDAALVWLDGVSHWAPHEAPDAVNEHLLAHLAACGGTDRHVLKIVDRATWETFPPAWPGAPVDHRDGFVHLSRAVQVEGTLRKHFAGRDDLVLLTVDRRALPPGALRWEVSRDGERFPHLYGPLPREAVVAAEPLPPVSAA